MALALVLTGAWTTGACADPLPTGYPGTPSSFRMGSFPLPYMWDGQFAGNIGSHGQQYFLLDFCNAGGFINELEASDRLVMTATDSDEYGWADGTVGSLWCDPFFDGLAAGQTFTSAFSAAQTAVADFSLPQQSDPSGLASNTLDYATGDIAFLFSMDDAYIGTQVNMDRVHDTLVARGWPEGRINVYHGFDADYDALDTIYAATGDPDLADNKIVVYIDGHGWSTDVVASDYSAGAYTYRVRSGLYRGWDTSGSGQYGLTELKVATRDPIAANYTWLSQPPNWNVELVAGADWYIRWWTDDSGFSLASGAEHTFSFSHAADPYAAQWTTYVSGFDPDGDSFTLLSDIGRRGQGAFVYNSPTNFGAATNYLGDGAVHSPTPEPATGLSLAGGLLLLWLRRRRNGQPHASDGQDQAR